MSFSGNKEANQFSVVEGEVADVDHWLESIFISAKIQGNRIKILIFP